MIIEHTEQALAVLLALLTILAAFTAQRLNSLIKKVEELPSAGELGRFIQKAYENERDIQVHDQLLDVHRYELQDHEQRLRKVEEKA